MSLFTILGNLLISPLKLLFEIIYSIAYRFLGNPGLSIIALSLVMNVLVLPLYRRADAMQEESRDVENKLAPGVSHIKKVFSGDERMMILQTYYRQNHYRPTDALKGSVSLLLEIPFFMAAYQFLSSLGELDGASLGPIANLGVPDGLIVIGSIAINALPILMTLVNIISSAIYLKGFPLKTKIQLYGMALFFLVFLYTSPAGLVFYWTLNNVFSLVKTIFYKLKNPQKTGSILLSVSGLGLLFYGLFFYNLYSPKLRILILLLGVVFQLPLLLFRFPNLFHRFLNRTLPNPNRKFFLLSCAFLTVLVGLLIPSTFIAASPQEFIDRSLFTHPLLHVLYTFCLATGTFMIWVQVFYWLANNRWKVIFEKGAWILCGIALINYMFFGTDLGIISANLQYENGFQFTSQEILLNYAALLACAAVMYLIVKKWPQRIIAVLLTAVIAVCGMGIINLVTVRNSVSDYKQANRIDNTVMAKFELSKNGQNVVVLMLDRALGQTVPYILNERPELKEQFAGFTYYDNVVSHGGFTNFATPSVFGGYEYTPVEMNRRSDETLQEKHNEALKVMPVLFNENDFDVTVCDLSYANYQWIPDLSIFQEYPNIRTYITEGMFSDSNAKIYEFNTRSRNFFCFSIMKIMPLSLQTTLYQRGNYNHAWTVDSPSTTQIQHTVSTATGITSAFTDAFSVLENLSGLTSVSDSDANTLLVLTNNATHEPILLQAPDYTVSPNVDNTEYDAAHTDRFTLGESAITVETPLQMSHYHANAATLIQLGKWFDYLRANQLYDNTRIILVSDHGCDLHLNSDLYYQSSDTATDLSRYFPLLMVKDFNSTEFTTSSEFMTNADVLTLASENLIQNPVNPFTGKAIGNSEKTAHDQFVIMSFDWSVDKNNGNTFLPSTWASVSDNIHDMDNWKILQDSIVLNEYKFS